ncbi:hypothetical protein TNCT_550661 [Trichonephila clavata]|uniref:Uncharacterized protein n=1 Tax=Trichonephila clavata TaxID=2740835 RepID=A0A8X6FWZ3_TRICU|nr:hypothetical protein TNCT_550661 [Trichonephila clavata]
MLILLREEIPTKQFLMPLLHPADVPLSHWDSAQLEGRVPPNNFLTLGGEGGSQIATVQSTLNPHPACSSLPDCEA